MGADADIAKIANKALTRISQEELEKLLRAGAKAGVEEYLRAKKKDKYNNTFALLKRYRDAAFYVEHAGQQASKLETALILDRINTAAEEIRRRRDAAGRDTEYEAFYMYFMQGIEYEKIAEKLNTGKNTPRRWVTGIVRDMTVLLYGLEEQE